MDEKCQGGREIVDNSSSVLHEMGVFFANGVTPVVVATVYTTIQRVYRLRSFCYNNVLYIYFGLEGVEFTSSRFAMSQRDGECIKSTFSMNILFFACCLAPYKCFDDLDSSLRCLTF